MYQSVIEVLTLLGIGSILSILIGFGIDKRKNKFNAVEELKRTRYKCILKLMIAQLDISNNMESIHLNRPDLKNVKDLKNEIQVELLNSVLFASQDVIRDLSVFVSTPNYSNFVNVANSMRADLWMKKSKVPVEFSSLIKSISP